MLNAKDELEQLFFRKPSRRLPPVAVSCGIPTGSPKAIGQCWSHTASHGKVTEIFVCPSLADPMDVLGTLLHELVHAAVGVQELHNDVFKRHAQAVGLIGPAKSCWPGDDCKDKLRPIAEKLGPYPHTKLEKTTTKKKKETKKRLKLSDPEISDYVVSMSEDIFKTHGAPIGPSGQPMVTPKKDDSQ